MNFHSNPWTAYVLLISSADFRKNERDSFRNDLLAPRKFVPLLDIRRLGNPLLPVNRAKAAKIAKQIYKRVLCVLSSFFHLRNLKISPTKSSATLSTTWTKEVGLELDVTVDGEKIPTVNHPKILGVTFDSLLMSSAHTTAICNKMRSRNKVLKSLAGSTWGMDKEILLTTYQTIGRSVVNYAAPVWTPRFSDTQWKKLQSCQNAALRTVTGCIQMTCEEHLHDETKMLSVKEHNIMLSKQFLLGCHRRDHPNHHLTESTPA
ncbi:uncharacterized protein LOC124419191 [Lucilia cuprina]|uniref:uncharacterized protein LOC124419191 n=1 Tax=Lucilia cuprina TaxID=7375 RepID=UPI001F05BE6A|nr:uncharacterized protein LOC124419191 [Lucilia cuprina]